MDVRRNTLNQILEVLKYFKYNFDSGKPLVGSYQLAITNVAEEHDVTYQTIGDGCRRRLNLRAITVFTEVVEKNILLEIISSGIENKIKSII